MRKPKGSTSEAKRLYDERQAKISEPSLVSKTISRVCRLSCQVEGADPRCASGYDGCVSQLTEEGLPRYSQVAKRKDPPMLKDRG